MVQVKICGINSAEAADAAASAGAEYAVLVFFPRAPRLGGHGAAFDWQLLRGRKFARPWLLSGGLNAENVARAIRACDAPGVDCSSGVETAPGLKSPQLIREFVAAARNAQFAGAES